MIGFHICHAIFAAALSSGMASLSECNSISDGTGVNGGNTSLVQDGGLSVSSNAIADCPGSVSVGEAVALGSGSHFRVTNNSNSDQYVQIVEEITDSQGGSAEHTEPRLRIGPHRSITERSVRRAVLRSSYSSPGVVVVNSSVTISDPDSGNVYSNSTNSCSFTVE
ncbi:MAG: hypothetical protein QM820_18770 [Minicystis sp.]